VSLLFTERFRRLSQHRDKLTLLAVLLFLFCPQPGQAIDLSDQNDQALSAQCLSAVSGFPGTDAWKQTAKGQVADIRDEDGTILLETGKSYSLSGLYWPLHALGPAYDRLEGPAPPTAPTDATGGWQLQAAQFLVDLLVGQTVIFYESDQPADRYGRRPAQIFVEKDNIWVQQALLSQGLARVWTRKGSQAPFACLYALEKEARHAKKGIWNDPRYRILTITDQGRLDTDRPGEGFRILEGSVFNVSKDQSLFHVNFGPFWGQDVTLQAKRAIAKQFKQAGSPLASFKGKRIRVRGWLRFLNGPMIDLIHPEQIEDLGP